MSSMMNSLHNIRQLEDLAGRDSYIHRLNPLIKLITTIIYLFVLLSFGRYEAGRMLPYFIYPVLIMIYSELPFTPIFKRLLLIEPFIIGIGILNPLFDSQSIFVGSISISRGWVTFLSIFIKSGLTVTAGLILIATTGMDRLAGALRMLKVPRIFVLQLLLTFRYISVLIEEVFSMQRAYALRAPGQKGISRHAWGSFAGQLLLRTFDRSQRVYQSMSLRGFEGEYNTGAPVNAGFSDIAYLIGWSVFFVIARVHNIPAILGSLINN